MSIYGFFLLKINFEGAYFRYNPSIDMYSTLICIRERKYRTLYTLCNHKIERYLNHSSDDNSQQSKKSASVEHSGNYLG